ncbi:MAG: T9SS type A sorting domain-containing protein [Calditrichaeota bacterium]|nr:T9SS type A sorting domain-containing protein [Calditrichota bacterium]
MKNFVILFLVVLYVPGLILGQAVVQSFDTQLDASYFRFETSGADAAKNFIVQTLDEENYAEGTGAMKMEWSVENSQSWGGYVKLDYMAPGSEVMDFSAYDSIAFWYNNMVAQSLPGRVHVRFELYDVSHASPSVTSNSQTEYYYSFEYILDQEAGWNEWVLPLEARADAWNGEAFNRTGWAGIVGNDFLDSDKIKGFGIELSISGTGEGDVATGTLLFDGLTLKGSKNALGENPGFEDGMAGWASDKQAESEYVEVKSAGSHSGTNYLEIGVADNAWAVAYRETSVAVAEKDEWKLSAWIKDVSAEYPGGDFAALKMEAKDANGTIIEFWEDVAQGISADWQLFSTSHIMPAGATQLTAVLVGSKWTNDGKAAAYGFDDVVLISLGQVDETPPDAPTQVTALPNVSQYFNLVSWIDVPGESNETYNVYASLNPINSLDDPGVEQIAAGVGEDAQSAIHYLIYPLKEKELTYYYAVECVDKVENVGPIAVSSGIKNVADAVPTISLNPPADFAADGDLSEWYDSDIMPFEFVATVSHTAGGSFVDENDLVSAVFMAVDDDFLYMAFDVFDDIFSFDPVGNFWEDDMAEVYIGLYNKGMYKHNGFLRGEEPDYKFIHLADRVFTEQFGSQSNPLYFNGNKNYAYVTLDPDWSIEIKVPLDSLLQDGASGDKRFHPVNGMKLPLDIAFHDSDSPNVRNGIMSYSPFNNDNSYQGAQNWYHTWVGDTNQMVTGLEQKTGKPLNAFDLKQNYPNPFNPTTTIEYNLAYNTSVKITVFNMLGQQIKVLVDGKHTAGTHLVNFDATHYASGVYFYQIEAGDFVQIRKMLLVK